MRFVEAINLHSLTLILSLMTDNHKLIDSLGTIVKGKENVSEAWNKYFKLFPDYFIRIDELIKEENSVMLQQI